MWFFLECREMHGKTLKFFEKLAFNFDLWCGYPYLGGGHEVSSMCAANP
jgi:hypothetical protein